MVKRCAFSSINEGVILDQALEESSRLCDWVVVVSPLRAKHGGFEGANVPDTFGATEPVDHKGVNRQDFDEEFYGTVRAGEGGLDACSVDAPFSSKSIKNASAAASELRIRRLRVRVSPGVLLRFLQ